MSNLEPRIYVACLAAYNNGYLHGKWIDAVQSVENIWDEINKMLASSPVPNADEFAIHDYEDFGEISISEYTGIETVNNLALFVQEHGILGSHILLYFGNDIEDATRLIEDCYHGEFDSEEDFAIYITQETWEIPDHLANYIDYKSIANDLFINDYISFIVDHKTYVFSHF